MVLQLGRGSYAAEKLLNDLRVLISRCWIKAAFNISSDHGLELRGRHTLNTWHASDG